MNAIIKQLLSRPSLHPKAMMAFPRPQGLQRTDPNLPMPNPAVDDPL